MRKKKGLQLNLLQPLVSNSRLEKSNNTKYTGKDSIWHNGKRKGRGMNKKLYKSNSNKIIEGVCGGIAEYFGIDATVVRLAWIIFSAMGGSGVLAYIIAMLIIPQSPEY